TPSSPPVFAGSRNQLKPPRFGLSSTGVPAGRLGTTASHSRLPSSSGVPPVKTVTGRRPAASRARCLARNTPPPTLSPVTATWGDASQAGEAADAVSAGAAGLATGGTPRLAASAGARARSGTGAGAGFGSLLPHPQAIATTATRRSISRSYHIAAH